LNKSILHIGYPKTASSWFQTCFYPKVRNVKYYEREIVQKLIISTYEFDFQKDFVQNNFVSEKTSIICEETLVGTISTGGFRGSFTSSIAKRLHKLFPNAKVVIFIRRQPDIIASAYLQYIRGGGTKSINAYLGKNVNLGVVQGLSLFTFKFLEYHRSIELYKSIFGEEKILVYMYEDLFKNRGNFIKCFCDDLELDIDVDKVNWQFKNQKFRQFLIPLVRLSNCFTRRNNLNKYYLFHIPGWFYLSQRIFTALNRLKIFGSSPNSKSVLGRKNFEYILDYYKESNRILKEKHLIDVEKNGYSV
jgi:hypothetical protein